MKRVVITGMGIYSCLGKNLESVNESLQAGRSGIVFDPQRKEMGFRSALTAKLERPKLKGKLHRRMRVGLSEAAEYAYISTLEALENAKMDMDFLEQNDVGILYGNDSTAKSVIESWEVLKEKKDTTLMGSGSIFQSMNSTISMNLSVIFKLKGINLTISGACASGSHAVGLGYQLIKSGLQKHIICGGGQEVNLHATGSFDGLGAFSIRESEPEKASRPFDNDRDGLVPGGGAATIIIEDYENAKKRGAPILGEIVGYGFSSNGDHISVPNVEGPRRALEMVLQQSKLSASAIDYVNAHATSTPVGDSNEAQAIFEVFGTNGPWVSSTKSMTGHEMWMGGASEIIYSILMMQNDFIAPNINFEEPDEHSAKLNILPLRQDAKINMFLSNSFGFGGTNSSLIIKRL